jgi:hypothetical protein
MLAKARRAEDVPGPGVRAGSDDPLVGLPAAEVLAGFDRQRGLRRRRGEDDIEATEDVPDPAAGDLLGKVSKGRDELRELLRQALLAVLGSPAELIVP